MQVWFDNGIYMLNVLVIYIGGGNKLTPCPSLAHPSLTHPLSPLHELKTHPLSPAATPALPCVGAMRRSPCLFSVVYYCSTYYKAVRVGRGG